MNATNCTFQGGIVLDNPNSMSAVTIKNCPGTAVDHRRGDAALAGEIERNGTEQLHVEFPNSGGASVTQSKVANGIEDIFDYSSGTLNGWADFLGFTHINPQYGFNGRGCLIEGAERLQELGSKSIKFYLSPNYRCFYAPNMQWDDYSSPVELAQSPSFQTMTDMDFNTFFIGTYIFSQPKNYAVYWKTALTEEQKQEEYQSLYDLTYYLCTRYAETDKTFILQNWEGDWATMDVPSPATDPDEAVLQRMIEWTNIRQDAVNNARRDANKAGVRVYHALEVNLAGKAQNGGKTVTNNVIPYTYCDYYSYSAYDTEMDPQLFAASLDYLKMKADNNLIPGKSRVFVGEFGLPENEFGAKKVLKTIKDVTEISREKGIDYVLYWQLYDNEVYDTEIPQNEQTNNNCRGYWLVKPSGAKTIAWNYFYNLIHGQDDPEYVPEEPTNFAAVEITLGVINQNLGLMQPNATDGTCTAEEKAGKTCHKSPGYYPNLYMYFKADDDFITPQDKNLEFTFTYYDEGTSPMMLEYFNQNSQLSSKTISRTDTQTWTTAIIRLSDVKFDNLFHGGFADFRFNDYGDSIYMHHVKISKWTPDGAAVATQQTASAMRKTAWP